MEAENVVASANDRDVVDIWGFINFGIGIPGVCTVYLHFVLDFSGNYINGMRMKIPTCQSHILI